MQSTPTQRGAPRAVPRPGDLVTHTGGARSLAELGNLLALGPREARLVGGDRALVSGAQSLEVPAFDPQRAADSGRPAAMAKPPHQHEVDHVGHPPQQGAARLAAAVAGHALSPRTRTHIHTRNGAAHDDRHGLPSSLFQSICFHSPPFLPSPFLMIHNLHPLDEIHSIPFPPPSIGPTFPSFLPACPES